MPALPGAQKISVTRGDCRSFHTKACSRPPPPKTRIRILLRSENAREQARVGGRKCWCQRGRNRFRDLVISRFRDLKIAKSRNHTITKFTHALIEVTFALRALWKTENTAPCGSARMAKRPTPSIVVGP